MKKLFFTIAVFALLSPLAQAQYINLTAEKQVEWDSKAQKMTAIGNAVASKKDMEIKAEKMTAFYAEDNSASAKNKTTLKEVHAVGSVIMTTPNAKAYGNTMDYDIIKDSIILIGDPAKIKTAKELITAKDSITYYPSENKAIALGEVYVEDEKKNKIHSDKMIAFFKKGTENGNMDLEKIEIYGNVKIISKETDVVADKGIYLPQTGIVKLYDNVLINQQGNKLHGDFAETNLNTGVSKLIAGKTSEGRVSGVFKEKKK